MGMPVGELLWWVAERRALDERITDASRKAARQAGKGSKAGGKR